MDSGFGFVSLVGLYFICSIQESKKFYTEKFDLNQLGPIYKKQRK